MRKVIMYNRVSLDGFYAGTHGEIDWFAQDPEVDGATHQMMHPDTLLLGRVTYQMFESFWPHVTADPNAPEHLRTLANELDQMTKVVFSKTLKEATWVNTTLLAGNLVETVRNLKQGDGADITIFGSGSIVHQLAAAGLIDEYLIALTPTILGQGQPLFKDVERLNLVIVEARPFASGNVVLHYRQAENAIP